MSDKFKFNPITSELDLVEHIPELSTDPSPARIEDAWVLRQGSGVVGGKLNTFFGLGFPYVSVGSGSFTYQLSYRTNAGTTYRVNLTTNGNNLITSVSNSNGTLTISPTTGTVVASLNLSNSNIWTALQQFSVASVKAGTSTDYANIGGTLFDHYADAGNVTTGETDLYSDTLAANTLGANGDKVNAQYGGLFVSSATATREIKIYFAGTAIFDTGALTLSLSSAWTVYATIVRVSASVVRYMISLTTEGAALSAYTAVGELTGLTLSSTAILKITGQAAGVGAATNDIVAKLGKVDFEPAA